MASRLWRHKNSDPENSYLRPQTLKTQTPKTLQTLEIKKKRFKLISVLITFNVLWSRNVHRQQPERSDIFLFSTLSLSHQSNSEKTTRFN